MTELIRHAAELEPGDGQTLADRAMRRRREVSDDGGVTAYRESFRTARFRALQAPNRVELTRDDAGLSARSASASSSTSATTRYTACFGFSRGPGDHALTLVREGATRAVDRRRGARRASAAAA
jgi:hypothetical protein